MSDENRENIEVQTLFQRFESLLMGDALSVDEKRILSQEIIKIIYEDQEEVSK